MIDQALQHLLLWRHADALPVSHHIQTDIDRPLSKLGKAQAKEMAKWLRHNLPENTLVLCSPARRTIETAQTLNREISIMKALAPGASLLAVIKAIQLVLKTPSQNLLIVGHQPWIGQLASYACHYSLSKPVLQNKVMDQPHKKAELVWLKKPLMGNDALFERHCSKGTIQEA